MKNKNIIIIGSSKGLGAELVEECLKKNYKVLGIARTPEKDIPSALYWQQSGNYKHIELDITSDKFKESFESLITDFAPAPVYIIFNAAIIKKDLLEDNSIDYETYKQIYQVGINALTDTIAASQDYLFKYGGCIIGISSSSALNPLICDKSLAYPSSKIFMNNFLQNLADVWREKKQIKILLFNLGYMNSCNKNNIAKLFIPTYEKTAKKIIKYLDCKQQFKVIDHNILYCLIYRYIMKIFPNYFYYIIFHKILKNIILKLKDNQV